MKKKLIVAVLLTSVVGLILAYLLFIGRIRFNYPDKDEFPIVGIDVSHHQGQIHWNELRTENVSFVVIKATEGVDYQDPLFKINWQKSKEAGYKTGAYHFYRLCKGGREQAQHFIETVPNASDNLPPTIDLEFGGNCQTEKTKEQVLNDINEFLHVIENHYNKRPIIYVTREFYDEYLTNEFEDYSIWIRDIFGRPALGDNRPWLIWQFANRGHLKGIDTYVDLNVLNGKSIEMLQ
jgi:lysozyme